MHGFIHLSQTNFTLITFFTQKRSLDVYILVILMTLILSACSTKPTVQESTPVEPPVIDDIIITTDTAQDKLAMAQSLHNNTPRSDQGLVTQQADIDTLLIDAAQLYLQEQNYVKSLWLANEISNSTQANYQNTYRLLLIKARSLFALNYPEQAQQQLQLAQALVTYTHNNNALTPLQLTLNYYELLSDVFTSQEKNVLALTAQLRALALTPELNHDELQRIWQNLETLTPWQLAQLVNINPPDINGWAQLLKYCQSFGENPTQLSRYLRLWQQQYPDHPAINIAEQLQSNNSSVNVTNDYDDIPLPVARHIAVLLPLSGVQKKAGLAAQQGILAAYNDNIDKQLYFIDTNQVNWDNLATHFSEQQIDHIIGPLLKPNVEKFLSISSQYIALQVPTLLLNLSSQHSLSKDQIALSMRPEDEAMQAASTLSQHNYKHPIILSHHDNVSKRIALAFSQQWLVATGESVDVVYFDQGKQMKESLQQTLDVNASETRIKQLSSRVNKKVKAESRNRRDVDMIYLVGNAAQTRLIKPYIDVNISPFAKIIPVFASSRSHSSAYSKHRINSIHDLKGLTFTQIPWLLDSKQQDKHLRYVSDTLWPNRSDSLSRIFAMGFDSYQLLDKISSMKKTPFIRHFGQTGLLTLNNKNILTRSLVWGQYKNNKVMKLSSTKTSTSVSKGKATEDFAKDYLIQHGLVFIDNNVHCRQGEIDLL